MEKKNSALYPEKYQYFKLKLNYFDNRLTKFPELIKRSYWQLEHKQGMQGRIMQFYETITEAEYRMELLNK